jgi:hypothetical protein
MPPFSSLFARCAHTGPSRDVFRPIATQPRGWRAVLGRFLEAR